jgi:hypothetical protein
MAAVLDASRRRRAALPALEPVVSHPSTWEGTLIRRVSEIALATLVAVAGTSLGAQERPRDKVSERVLGGGHSRPGSRAPSSSG